MEIGTETGTLITAVSYLDIISYYLFSTTIPGFSWHTVYKPPFSVFIPTSSGHLLQVSSLAWRNGGALDSAASVIILCCR